MARSKNKGLPHHVKERLRHQNLQKILEDVASHVPKPATTKKETKAKKLRRVVLYMKYLIHKKETLDETKNAIKSITKFQDDAVKTSIIFPEVSPVHKPKRKRAQIVFLSKLLDKSANQQEDTGTLIHQKSCNNTGNELEIQTEKNTVNVIDQSQKNVLSSENGLKLFHKKPNKSATAGWFVPNMGLKNVSGYDIGPSKENYPTISRASAEKKIGKTGSNYIAKDHIFNECQNYCIHGKEISFSELNKNGSNLEQYIQDFSKDLEKMHKSFSPDKNIYQSDKLERSSTDVHNCEKGTNFIYSHKKSTSPDEYSLHYIERPRSFNEFIAPKSCLSSCDVQVDKHQLTEKPSFSLSPDNFSFKNEGTMTPLNNFEIPRSFSNSVTKKNDHQCYDDIKFDKQQCSNHKMFSQGSINSSPDFFSSGESGALISLPSFEKPYASNCSVRPKNHQPIQCDVKVDRHQFSKHPSFSQSSDNFSSDIFSSGESGTFISSNEYVLSENDQIAFTDDQYQSTNTSPSISFRPESTMGEDSYDFSHTPPQRNCDIISSPDIFCDMKQDIPRGISDFSVDNILSKSSYKNPFLFSPNSERCLDYNIHEPNYNIPTFYNNVVDSRFINYFGMNNYSQNLPLHALPRFAPIGNYPTVNMEDVRRYSNVVPNDENYMINSYSPEKACDFNHSMYADEGMGNHLRVPIKQEDTEPFLPPEELSYSLNNFTNSGYCYSQRDCNTH